LDKNIRAGVKQKLMALSEGKSHKTTRKTTPEKEAQWPLEILLTHLS
jgi:hypothetical protein